MVGNLTSVTAAPTRTSVSARDGLAVPPAAPEFAPTGNTVAASGQDLPLEQDTPPPAEELENIVRKLNELMAQRQRSLSFRVDEASGRTVITVLDASTAQVVRQIPSEEVLALARAIEESLPLVDARI